MFFVLTSAKTLKTLQVKWSLPPANVIGKLKGLALQRNVAFLGHEFLIQFYPQGRKEAPNGRFSLAFQNRSSAEPVQFAVLLGGQSLGNGCVNKSQMQWQNDYSPNFQPVQAILAGQCTSTLVISIRFLNIDGKNPQMLKDEHLKYLEDNVKRLNQQCTALNGQGSAQRSEIQKVKEENLRLHSLIDEGFAAQQERGQRVVRAAVQIQAFWRMTFCRRRLPARRYQRRWQDEIRKPHTTPYDAILAFDSLAEFLEKGQLSFLQKAESQLKLAEERRYRIVAVVGLFDKGKTWLMNKLFGVSLPSGKLHTTKGFSFLWIEKSNMLVLDSAGVQSPVSLNKGPVDTILDAQTTESLMFEMISRIAHHMIFVVNDLTWTEQRCIEQLERKYKDCRQHKELIVVHNYRDTTEVEEAITLFQERVTQCYPGVKSHLGELIFTSDAEEGARRAHHIGLCNDFSVAGDKFNKKNSEYLLQGLEQRNTAGEGIKMSARLCEEFGRLLHPHFVNIETAAERAATTSDPPLRVEFVDDKEEEDEFVTGEYIRAGKVVLKTGHADDRLTMKKVGVIGPLGEIIAHDVSFNPHLNVVEKSTEEGVQRVIYVECPGVKEAEVERKPNGVRIEIDKKPLIAEKQVVEVRPIQQSHGIWEREYLVPVSEGAFELDEDASGVEDGVLTVVLKKVMKTEKVRLGQKAQKAQTSLASSPMASEASLRSWRLA